MSARLLHIPFDEVFYLSDYIASTPDQASFTTLADSPGVRMQLLALTRGDCLAPRHEEGDTLVHVLEGEADLALNGLRHLLHRGENLAIPSRATYTLKAPNSLKMLLTILLDE